MITFGFGVHIHQPIGNFDSVIEKIYQKAYLPFLNLISQFPRLKVNYHISGCLFEWLTKYHPEFIELLKELIKKGQVEILTAGFYEPILTLLPTNDCIDQIKWYSDFLEKKLGIRPSGLWLTERVWEQHLTKSLVAAGVKYTVVDDTHFKYSGLTEEALSGYFVTEQEGETLAVFPVSKKLRYLVPFQPVARTIKFLYLDQRKGSNRLRLLFDDGEKFGAWPSTHRHCYDNGWLKDFFSQINKSDFIRTTLLQEYLKNNPPMGRIYLDNASYDEMGEWLLSSKQRLRYKKIKESFPNTFGLLRGGFFRNFLVKYPEANLLHKRMLYVSKRIAQSKRKNNKKARIELFKGQCNDAYWHGIFGGLYLPHLRNAVCRHLIKANELITHRQKIKVHTFDFDGCGSEEIIFDNKNFFLVVAPHCGGAILCLDLKQFGINLFNIIGRHQESYHQQLKSAVLKSGSTPAGIKSIHSELKFKENVSKNYLIYDSYPRLSGLDHFFQPATKVADFYSNNCREVYNLLLTQRNYQFTQNRITLLVNGFGLNQSSTMTKIIDLYPAKLRFTYLFQILPFSASKTARFGIEFGLSPLCYLLVGQQKFDISRVNSVEKIRDCTLPMLGFPVQVNIKSQIPFDFWFFPIYTISSSESGLERVYQGTVVLLSWQLAQRNNKFSFEFGWSMLPESIGLAKKNG